MKKFFKKIIIFSLSTFALSACANLKQNESSVSQKNKLNNSENKKSYKLNFLENKYSQELLQDYLTNKEAQKEYLFKQDKISEKNIYQLKYSLAWFNPLHSSEEHTKNNTQIRKDGENFIFNTITKDWWWYLTNITKMNFAFNPYGKLIHDNYDDEESDFDNQIKKFSKLYLSLEKNLIEDLYKIKLEQNQNDFYKEKYVYYLQYNKKYFIKTYKLVDVKNLVYYIVWPDVYFLNIEKMTQENVLNFWKKFEKQISDKRKKAVLDDIEFYDDEQEVYKIYNDENLYKNSLDGVYYDFLFETIKEINKNSSEKIYRYTLRGTKNEN